MPGSGSLFAKDGGRVGYATLGGVREDGMPSDEQLDYVARTMMKEDPANLEAIAHVIRNRTLSGRYGSTPQDVVTAPKQFSPWNEDLRGTRADPRLVKTTDPLYQKALGAARTVFGGESEDPTGGATHFYNPKLASPKWGSGMQDRIQIGEHAYGKADAGAGMANAARAELAQSRARIPTGDPRRSFLARDEEAPARAAGVPEGGLRGLAREEYVIPALMGLGKGLSAMMSAKTVSPGAAIAAGLGEGVSTGAESYMGVQKQKADILKDTLGLMSERYTPMMGGGYWDKVTGRPVSAQERIAAVADMVPGLGGIMGGAAAPAAGGVPAAAGAPAAAPAAPGAAAVETAKALPKTETPTAAKTPEEKAIEDVNRIPTVADAMNKADSSQARVEELLRLQSAADPALAGQFEEKIKIAKDDAQRDRQNAIALQQTFLQSKLQEVRQRSEAELREEKEPGISAKKLTAEELSKNYSEDQAAARRADKSISNIKRARQLLQTGGFHTGYGGENILEGLKAASAASIPGAKEMAAAADQFRAITTGMVVDLANGSLGGGVSNGDIKVLSSTKPGLTTEYEANMKILDDMERLENRKKEIAVLENKWMAAHNGRLTPEFNAYLANWAEEHPLFSEEERRQAETGATSSEAPLPMPKTADELIVGRKYNTNQGVLTWNGSKFVKR